VARNLNRPLLPFNRRLSKREDIAKELRRLIGTPGCNELDVKPFVEHYPCVIPTPWILNHQEREEDKDLDNIIYEKLKVKLKSGLYRKRPSRRSVARSKKKRVSRTKHRAFPRSK
jgi:hypothetical protein